MVVARRRRLLRRVGLTAGSLAVLAGCGGPTAQYVSNSDAGFFLKVPNS